MSSFGPAHAVVIDCALFLAAQVMADDRTDLVWDQLARALPEARTIGDPEIDRIIAAAATLQIARKALQAGAASGTSSTHAEAHWGLRSAVTHYAWARLTKSASALASAPNLSTPQKRPAT